MIRPSAIRWVVGFSLCVLPMALGPGVLAASPEEAKKSLSLLDFIKRALHHNTEIKVKVQDIRLAESKREQFRAEMKPTIKAMGLVAPITKDVGNALQTEHDYQEWGALFKGMAYVVQPIYSFGRFDVYNTATLEGVQAEKDQTEMKEAEVIYDVKNYYYSAQMAFEMLTQLNETEEKLNDVVRRIDELLAAESGEVKQEDAYKLKILQQELNKNEELVQKGTQLAVAALSYKSGFSPDADIMVQSKKLVAEPFQLKSLTYYQDVALNARPEMAALKAGIKAREALVTAEKKGKLPILFLGGLLDASDTQSNIRNRQDSPYANDPYNRIAGGIGVGFQWNLDFWKANAKVSEARAEHLKLVHKKEMAEQGIPVEVKKAYLEYKEALNNIGHATQQRDHAKKWFMQSVFAWSFGIGDSREVLESVIFKGLSDKNYYEAILNHNVAIAALSKATGQELLAYLQY